MVELASIGSVAGGLTPQVGTPYGDGRAAEMYHIEEHAATTLKSSAIDMTLKAVRSVVVRLVVLVCGLTSSLGCGPTDSASPVATPAVELNRTRVPLGGPVEMTYRFTVADDVLGFTDDYRVFVHFLDADGELMFEDDHAPAVPTTSWRPGQQITYERRMIVPVYPYVGEVTIAIGLYSVEMGDRLPLAGESLGQRAYRVATLEMAPQSESGFLVFEHGWHQAESGLEEPARTWQWTTGQATIAFRNPRVDSTLNLEVEGRPELFDVPQVLTLTINDIVIETLELGAGEPTYHIIPMPAASLGDADDVVLALNVDQTFVPSEVIGGQNADQRELGVQVFYTFFDHNSSP